MMTLRQHLAAIASTPGCSVDPPIGQPVLRAGDELPGDLRDFYDMCGGVTLFAQHDYSLRISGPREFTRSNPEIAKGEQPDDITDAWYIVARGGSGEALSIDCSPGRLGQCYDSFWDSHGLAGNCPVVARTFSELLHRLLDNRGEYWYWLRADAPAYGEA
jgi:hypothetical protein